MLPPPVVQSLLQEEDEALRHAVAFALFVDLELALPDIKQHVHVHDTVGVNETFFSPQVVAQADQRQCIQRQMHAGIHHLPSLLSNRNIL